MVLYKFQKFLSFIKYFDLVCKACCIDITIKLMCRFTLTNLLLRKKTFKSKFKKKRISTFCSMIKY